MKGGNVEFSFTGNTKDVEQKAKGLSSNLKNLVSTGATALLSLGTAAATALGTIMTKTLKAQGELEQQIGGTKAVFEDYADTVQSDAAKAFDTMGLSANDYMQTINKLGALMKGSGIDTKKAMDLSSKAMQRASDVASVMGISTEEAMRAITGAAKGNFTMMDNIGVAMNATTLQAYALSKGIKTAYKDMEQGEKIELAMAMFLERSAYAAGNYAKENDTLVGSISTLKAATQNLITGTGSVDQVISALQNVGKIIVEKAVIILPQIVQGLVGLINAIIPMLPTIVEALLPALIQGVTQLIIGLIGVLPDLVTQIADMLPELIPQIVEAIMLIIPALIQNLPAFIEAGVKLTLGIVKGIVLGAAQLIKSIYDMAKQGIAKLKETFAGKSPLEIGKMLIEGLWKGIANAKKWVLDKIKGLGKEILKGVKGIFGIKSPSKEFEIIGRFNMLGLEQGMEKESANLQSSFDDMFSLSPSLYGTSSTNLSPTVNVFNSINMKQDALGQMVNDIKTFSGGAKNDYSYGMGA